MRLPIAQKNCKIAFDISTAKIIKYFADTLFIEKFYK